MILSPQGHCRYYFHIQTFTSASFTLLLRPEIFFLPPLPSKILCRFQKPGQRYGSFWNPPKTWGEEVLPLSAPEPWVDSDTPSYTLTMHLSLPRELLRATMLSDHLCSPVPTAPPPQWAFVRFPWPVKSLFPPLFLTFLIPTYLSDVYLVVTSLGNSYCTSISDLTKEDLTSCWKTLVIIYGHTLNR